MNGPDSRALDWATGGADVLAGWLSKRGALGVSAYAFHGSQASSRRYSGAGAGRGRTGGDAAGGSAHGSASGSANTVESMSGGSEGGTSEDVLSGGETKGCLESRLDKVAFLRRKPAIASYEGCLGEGGKGGKREGRW